MLKKSVLITLLFQIATSNTLKAGLFGLESNPQALFAATALCVAVPTILYKTCSNKPQKSRGERELEKFVAHFKIPETTDLTTLIDKGNDIDRLINAYRAQRLIENEKFKYVGIPLKYAKKTSDGLVEIFAQKITPSDQQEEKYSLAQVKDFASFVELSGLSDFGDNANQNIIYANDKLYVIDTENSSFEANTYGFKATNLKSLKIFFGKRISDDASHWLDAKIDELKTTHQDSGIECPTIATMPDLYTTSFDLQLVKKQLQLNRAVKQYGPEYVKMRALYNELRKDTETLL
ncbi:MAG TPA: hypothetical protein VHO47_04385 [Candidatus Babeliales bacterium]|nr:hypothetical protein [Candidatus Babeliales bacterium]